MNEPSDSEDDNSPPPHPLPAVAQAPTKESKKERKPVEYGFRRADGLVGPKGCVFEDKRDGKHRAFAQDRRTGKNVYNGLYATPEEAWLAVRAKQDELDPLFEAMSEFQEASERTKDLPVSPEDINDAQDGTVYRHQDPHNKFVPFAAVRVKDGKRGYKWQRACQHVDAATGAHCAHKAKGAQTGAKALFCKQHGGGVRCQGSTHPKTGKCTPCVYNLSVNKGDRDHYDGMCVRCFCVTKPDDPRAVNAKTWMNAKEQTVRQWIEETFKEYYWTFDTAYGGKLRAKGTPKEDAPQERAKRPDARTHSRGRVLIIEIDEYSHKIYDCGKEREREEIFKQHSGPRMQCVMLRFNPDEYTDPATGKRVPTCFKYNKVSGTVTVNPTQKKQWEARLFALAERIRVFIDRKHPHYMEEVPEPPPGRCMYMEELFYDDVLGMSEKSKANTLEAMKRIGKERKRVRLATAGAGSSSDTVAKQPKVASKEDQGDLSDSSDV